MPAAVFGDLWDAPICDDALSVPTPVGIDCLECGEAVAEGDCGVMIGYVKSPGQSGVAPIHRECHLRSAVGSIGHLLKACHCYGGATEDPAGLTRRQSALGDRPAAPRRQPEQLNGKGKSQWSS